jgi:hypothetical protein
VNQQPARGFRQQPEIGLIDKKQFIVYGGMSFSSQVILAIPDFVHMGGWAAF